MLDDKLAEERVKEFYESYRKNVIDKWKDKWAEYYRKYRSILEESNHRESNLFIPRCFDSVETVVPRLVLALFSTDPAFKMMPVGPSDVEAAKLMTTLLSYYYRVGNLFATVFNATKSQEIFNTSLIKSAWDEVKKIPVHYVVQVGDFFIDETALSIEEAEYCGDRKIRSLEYLRQKEEEGIYKNIDKVKQDGSRYSHNSSGSGDISATARSIIGLDSPYKTDDDKNPKYEVLECFYNGSVITTAGGVLIRNDEWEGEFPYSPIITCPDCMDFFGIGTVEPIRYIQDEINDLNNAFLDNTVQTLRPISKVSVNEFDRYKSWVNGSNRVWIMNDIKNGHEFDRVPPVNQQVFSHYGMLNESLDRTNGLTDYVRGMKTTGEGSATEATILAQAADNRLKLKLFMLQHCLKRMVKIDIENIQKFADEEFIVRLTEEPLAFQTFKRIGLKGNMDIYPMGAAELVSRDVKRAQYINLLGTLINPAITEQLAFEGKQFNLSLLLRQILETFETKELDKIITGGAPRPVSAPVLPAGNTPPVDLASVLKSTAESTAPLQIKST